MPKEQVWGDVVTVRVGDLPVMAARGWDDLADVPRPGFPSSPDVPTDVHRRRYQLCLQFVESTAIDLDPANDVAAPDVLRNLRERHAALTAQLDRLRASTGAEPRPADAPDRNLTPAAQPIVADLRDPATQLRVQQTLDVRWGRDEQQVGLFAAAWDHDAGEPVDLGGHWVTLGWSQLNKLIRKLRVARDQSFGTPE